MEHTTQPTKRPKKIAFGVIAVVLLASGIGVGAVIARLTTSVRAPEFVVNQFESAVYLPTRLPGTYRVDQRSFSIQDHTLVFKATDSTDGTIAFTEQKRPPNIDFDVFYRDYMKDAKVLDTARYASALGYSLDGKARLLSVVTDETWVLVSTTSPLDDQAFVAIAQSMEKQ